MVDPVIAPGVPGNGFTTTANVDAAPAPQEFVPATVTFPLIEPTGKSTVIIVVFAPAVIIAPAGTVQLYPVAFAMAETIYIMFVVFSQTVAFPEIAPAGATKGRIVIASVVVVTLLPQAFVP